MTEAEIDRLANGAFGAIEGKSVGAGMRNFAREIIAGIVAAEDEAINKSHGYFYPRSHSVSFTYGSKQ